MAPIQQEPTLAETLGSAAIKVVSVPMAISAIGMSLHHAMNGDTKTAKAGLESIMDFYSTNVFRNNRDGHR